MKLAKFNTTAKVETQPSMRRLKVCAMVVKPRQTGPDHDGQAEQSDLAGPRSGTRTGRMLHPRRLRSLRLPQLDRLADSLQKQNP
jgi:hypothetical protein